jgi:hypothetical protein
MRNVGTAPRLRPEGSHAPIHEDLLGVPRATKPASDAATRLQVAATEPGDPCTWRWSTMPEAKTFKLRSCLPNDLPRSRVRPEAAAVEQAAKWLIGARRPLIIPATKYGVRRSGRTIGIRREIRSSVASGPGGYRSFHPGIICIWVTSTWPRVSEGRRGSDSDGRCSRLCGRVVPSSPEAPADAHCPHRPRHRIRAGTIPPIWLWWLMSRK